MFPPNPNVPHVFPSLDSFSNHEKYDVPCEFLFHAYNNSAADPVKPDIVTTFSQDFVWQQRYREDGHPGILDSSVISSRNKKMASQKRDENRKIDTAQGPKDRRVRLSTEIAGKFFSLQDLLGFDRASNTLDWLLTNSVTAIKELVEEKNQDSSDLSNLKFLEAFINGGGSDENVVNGGKKKSVVVVECVDDDNKKTKTKRKHEGESFNVAREQSRAAARARARERTREKMRVKKQLNGSAGGCWSEIEPESDDKDIRSECIMDPETPLWFQSQDSLYQNLEHYFDDQQVIMQLEDLTEET